MAKYSPLDRLTDQERAIVRARLANPKATLLVIAKLAKIKGNPRSKEVEVSRVLCRPRVVMVLKNPPPTVTDENEDPNSKLSDPTKAREWLRSWYVKIIESKYTPQSERIRALNAVAEMTPGAKVPVGVHHSGAFTLEKFVEAAGGKPNDAPSKVPNQDEITTTH